LYGTEPKIALFGAILFLADILRIDKVQCLSTQGAKTLNSMKNSSGNGVDYSAVAKKF
jgi:hypothetical protein